MKNKFLKCLLFSGSLMVLFSACRKDSFEGAQTGNSGKTFVWIFEDQTAKASADIPFTNSQFFSPFTNVKAVNLFSVRRDAASSADLNKAVTITLVPLDQTYLDNYNATNGTNFSPLTPDLYTFASNNSIKIAGDGTVTMNFAAGEFSKNLAINLDGSKMDLSQQYAAGYALKSTGGFAIKSGADSIVSILAIKNAYDGVYTPSGTVHRDADLTLGGPYVAGLSMELATSAANQVTFDLLWADGEGAAGVDPIILTVNQTTNLVTVTSGINATLMNIPDSDNFYDPATKTFTLNFVWNGTDPAHRSASMTLAYTGPR